VLRHWEDLKPGTNEYTALRLPARRQDGHSFTNFTARLAEVAGVDHVYDRRKGELFIYPSIHLSTYLYTYIYQYIHVYKELHCGFGG